MDSRDLQVSEDLLAFIGESPSMFHTAAAIRRRLEAAGFAYLPEGARWNLQPGGRYFTQRNGSSTIAFKVGAHVTPSSEAEVASAANASDAHAAAAPGSSPAAANPSGPGAYHFQIAAVHGDSPGYKVKAAPELSGPGDYLRLNVEAYGGVIDSTWLDRPLSLAGRVMVRTDTGIASRLLSIDRDILLIPNVAIHLNHQINRDFAYNRQVDLCPLFSAGELSAGAFDELLAQELGVDADDIVARDLFLVNRQKPVLWGAADEFVSAPHLDDLQGTYSCFAGFLAGGNDATISVYACFDNEEVGSGTKQGALSTFLADTLRRVNAALGGTGEDYLRALAGSFLVSCDNAHAVHPNHPEMTDAENRAWLNRGIVVKEAANQKYTTDAFSRAAFEELCRRAQVPFQRFANRSDRAGGSTLGNLSNTQVSVHAVDIGLPQLAMHSAFETAGSVDTRYAVEALTAFFNTNLVVHGADAIELR